MKTSVLLALLLFPVIIFSQPINHFNQSGSKWNVAITKPAGSQNNPSFVATTTTVFGTKGDTMVGTKQWFKLYSTTDSLFLNNLEYRGIVRTESNRVLFSSPLNQLDTLYDFNLNVGDSVLFNLFGTNPEWLQVINVDSVQINGVFYKRQKFNEPSINAFDRLDEIWIEGIGSLHGPLFPNFPVKFSQEIADSSWVTCTFSGNQSVWQNPYYSDCFVNITLGIDKSEIENFRLYPNPFYDKIYFENIKAETLELAVLNSLGQVVKQIKRESNLEFIDLSELNEGIYFLRFNDQINSRLEKVIKS
jgi:hypothetical protein